MTEGSGQPGTDAALLTSLLGPLGEVLQPIGGPTAGWLVLPSKAQPRLLIPAHSRRLASYALTDYVRNSKRSKRALARVLERCLRAGLPLPAGKARRLEIDAVSEAALVEHLSELAGEPVRPAVHLGRERANRKPVISLLSPKGRLVAVAKVATNGLVAELLEREAEALRQMADYPLAGLAVPRSLRVETWRGVPLFLQSALPLRAAAPGPALKSVLATVALMTDRSELRLRFVDSPWWKKIQAAINEAPAAGGGKLAELSRSLEATFAKAELSFGPCHGDLSPWNAASLEGSLLLWDWERFEEDAPVGLDGLHYFFSELLRAGAAPRRAARALFEATASVLASCHVNKGDSELTKLAYVAWMATRYLTESERPLPRAESLASTLLDQALQRTATSRASSEAP
ncbi:MAG: hypothetical protein ACRDZP_05855 [Acidimicrobiales bacterium]